jgi:hypothetical protein
MNMPYFDKSTHLISGRPTCYHEIRVKDCLDQAETADTHEDQSKLLSAILKSKSTQSPMACTKGTVVWCWLMDLDSVGLGPQS